MYAEAAALAAVLVLVDEPGTGVTGPDAGARRGAMRARRWKRRASDSWCGATSEPPPTGSRCRFWARCAHGRITFDESSSGHVMCIMDVGELRWLRRLSPKRGERGCSATGCCRCPDRTDLRVYNCCHERATRPGQTCPAANPREEETNRKDSRGHFR